MGETYQRFDHIKIEPVGFTHPADEACHDIPAALALAATVAGQCDFRHAGRSNHPRLRFGPIGKRRHGRFQHG
jgi:sirohydrochlorin ferrochelatase